MTVIKGPVGKSLDDFEIESQPIGSGGSAEVFKAKSKVEGYEGKYFAIKKIRNAPNGRNFKKIRKEIEIHSQLSNSSIVKYYSSFECEGYWYIVLELCEKGSLQEYIKCKKNGKLSEKEVYKFMKDVIEGVRYLYSLNFIHRDLSLKNLLLTKDNEVKIADFGLAKSINDVERKPSIVGTVNFMAPEVFDGCYNFKTDWWSVGCILYALLYNTPPFHAAKKEDVEMRIKNCDLSFPDNAIIKRSKAAKDLVTAMLQKKADDRIEMKDVLNHKFFKKYEKYDAIYMTNSQKNGDSGMNSLTHSSSSSHIHSVCNSESRKSVKRSIYNKQISNVGYQDSDTRSVGQYDSNLKPKIKRNCSPSHLSEGKSDSAFKNHLKNKRQILPSCKVPNDSMLSRQINPMPSNCNSLQELNEINSQMYSFSGTSIQIQDKQKGFSHGHEFYPPEVKSIPRSNNSSQQFSLSLHKRSDSGIGITSNEKESKSENVTRTPLNTTRVKRHRQHIRDINAVITILNDGQVCLEILKLVENKEQMSRVYFISEDGMTINIFRPKKEGLDLSNKPPSHNEIRKVRSFTFENLPKVHWKNYKHAKRFVDIIRSKTPKIIFYGKYAQCIMMENTPNPDYEVNFHNGYQITEVRHKITIKDKSGTEVVGFHLNKKGQSMLSVFKKMKEACKKAESDAIAWEFSDVLDHNFPVKIGTPPRKSAPKLNKENVTSQPSLNGTVTDMKSFDTCKFRNSTSNDNFIQKSRLDLSCERNTAEISRNEVEILRDLPKSKFDVLEGELWVHSEYKDKIHMFFQIDGVKCKFFDKKTDKWILLSERPDLRNRFDCHKSSIIRSLLNEHQL